jgi:2-polyprenyl-6-hydroxyphenyl methylase/3-demethylubiquinone-9 3-methyltransferase
MNETSTVGRGHSTSAQEFGREVEAGERFEFGENWQRFLSVLDERRIEEAERSLTATLGVANLEGREFLDAGSGSGLFSLAAMRLGAERVHSFDFDPSSVACTQELRRRFFPGDDRWTVEQGSVLDDGYLDSLGAFSVVYSWGVLHHTGEMWRAMGNVDRLVDAGGFLYISIYNDQGRRSRVWRRLKRRYNALPRWLRGPFAFAVMGPRELAGAAKALLLGRPLDYVRGWTEYHRSRGMSRWHDIVDWIGGYPFEVAKPEQVFDFYRDRGYALTRLTTRGGGIACNEYLFRKGS